MKKCLLLCACLVAPVFAADPPPAVNPDELLTPPAPAPVMQSAAPAVIPASALPAMNFYGSIAGDELFELIHKNDLFARLDKQLWGSPLYLRITHSLQPTAGGKASGFMSSILSGGTLGLLPMVTNNELVVTYEIRVHGREYASYSFQRTFTRAVNIWAKDNTYGLGKDGLEWLRSTATQFVTAAAADAKIAELKKEYERYFGAAQ